MRRLGHLALNTMLAVASAAAFGLAAYVLVRVAIAFIGRNY